MSPSGNADDPFAQGAEPQRTIIRPTPGRGSIPQPVQGSTMAPTGFAPAAPRAALARAAAGPDPLAAPADPADLARGASNPLIAAAMPLLGLVVRMRMVASGVNIASVRERVYEELRVFAGAGRNAGVAQEPLRAAHYALSATVDDVVMNTPWGAHGGWSKRTMVSAFHGDVEGGERTYNYLEQMLEAPAANRSTLELMYCCLSLGFEGRYRLHPRGQSEHAKVRENLYNTLRGLSGPLERELSPEWRGVDAPNTSSRRGLPVWVVAAASGLIVFLVFAGLMIALSALSEGIEGRFAGLMPMGQIRITPTVRPVPVVPTPVVQRPVRVQVQPTDFHRLLEPEIRAGLVTVEEVGRDVKITILSGDMFAVGDAQPRPALNNLLHRIGEELRREPGNVIITGHTDNQPIRSLRFPSNQVLSVERANNSARLIGEALGDTARLTARGRADTQPVADNGTEQGRARNRRIEVVLQRPPQ